MTKYSKLLLLLKSCLDFSRLEGGVYFQGK